MAFRSEHREWLDEIERGPRTNHALLALKFAAFAVGLFTVCALLWRIG